MYTVVDRVQGSALLLDKGAPGWAPKVDVERLDLGSPVWCVLGQIYGTFADGWRAIRPWRDPTQSYAFTPLPGGEVAWAAEIARRTEPTSAPAPKRELVAV